MVLYSGIKGVTHFCQSQLDSASSSASCDITPPPGQTKALITESVEVTVLILAVEFSEQLVWMVEIEATVGSIPLEKK